MTEIEKTEGEIKVLQAKLELLKEMENHKSPAEEAYKRVYGFYPETYEDSWSAFQDGFFEGCKVEEPDESVEDYLTPQGPQGPVGPGPKGVIVGYEPTSQETQMTLEKSCEFSIVSYNGETYYRNLYDGICGGWYKTDTDGEVFYLVEDETERKLEKLYHEQVVVKEPEKEQKWDVIRESVKWCEEHRDESVEDWVKPQTQDEPTKPANEVLDRLENKYENDEVVNRMLKKWEENPPSFLRFELGKTLEGLISDWLDDCVPAYSTWDYELGIAILIRRIEKWLPDFQSSSGSQNVDTELLVDGYNDALTKIKSKLRNKK